MLNAAGFGRPVSLPEGSASAFTTALMVAIVHAGSTPDLDPFHHLLESRRFVRETRLVARAGLPHRDSLAHLLELELDDRSQRRAERRLQEARFPHRKRLEDFHFEQSAVNAAQLHQLARGEYIARAENVIFIGDSGTGKSHLATGLTRPE